MGTLKKHYLIIAILVLAAVLRLYNLANNPPGLTWDEAALGYNSYSIFLTGKDEYGTLLPLNLKSFGDWKPALYAYLDIPFIGFLGLNELAVRLPSALSGIIGVYGVYLLIYEIFKRKNLALSAAFFFAISPWSIQFSRAAFEANVALTFNILATYFFVKGLETKKWWNLSAIFYGLSLLTYQASRAFIPIFLIALFLMYRKEIRLKNLITPGIIMLVFVVAVGSTFLLGQTSRLQTENYFAYQRSAENTKLIASEDGWSIDSPKFQVLHGQWWEYVKGLVERYTIYFSPKTLFIDGDYSQRHRVPDLGALYYFSMFLIPLGFIYFIKDKSNNKKIILAWLMLAPIPAVLSRDLITTLRALNLAMPMAVLDGAGLLILVNKINSLKITKELKYLGLGLVCLLIVFNFAIYLDRYFIHAPKEYSKYWLYGYKQILSGVDSIKSNYNKVVISDVYGQPYIYYLFYNKYPPSDFQKQAVLEQPSVDVGTVRKIDNVEFRHIYWPNDRGAQKGLFIGSLDELPDKDVLPFSDYKDLKDINFLEGDPAFRIVETK